MKYEQVKLDKLIPYINNSKKHSDEQIKKVASSIKEFGFVNPIIVDKENGIIAGHCRAAAAQVLNLKQVPVLRVEHLSEAQKKAYIIADNRLSEVGSSWDMELLNLELESLKELDFDIAPLGFDFVFDSEIAKKLKPKIVLAENVKGLIQGNARYYVKQIFDAFREAGYTTQLFLLNAASMGVPQARERTFFIAHRNDLLLSKLKLEFNEKAMSVKEAWIKMPMQYAKALTDNAKNHWIKMKPGQTISKVNNGSGFNNWKLPFDRPSPTKAASGGNMHPLEPRHLSQLEHTRLQTFPDDINLMNEKAQYVCGMSVPPFMMQRIAEQIQLQWLDKLTGKNTGMA